MRFPLDARRGISTATVGASTAPRSLRPFQINRQHRRLEASCCWCVLLQAHDRNRHDPLADEAAQVSQSRTDGFSLLEATASIALTATILVGLSSITGLWLPNWRRGFADLQRADGLGQDLERLLEDLSVAEYVTPWGNAPGPLFEGDPSSVVFVRSAIGPNARPELEVVRFGAGSEERGPALMRTRVSFAPGAPGGPAQPLAFTDPTALVRAPYQITFCLCGSFAHVGATLEERGTAAGGYSGDSPGRLPQTTTGVDDRAAEAYGARRRQARGAGECVASSAGTNPDFGRSEQAMSFIMLVQCGARVSLIPFTMCGSRLDRLGVRRVCSRGRRARPARSEIASTHAPRVAVRAGRRAGYRGSTVAPISAASIAAAHWRPSRIAQTTSDWPRRMSPQANTFRCDVA